MKIKEFQKIIKEISDIDLEAESIADSRRILVELNQREKILKDLKKHVKKDMKIIEHDFLAKMHDVNVYYADDSSQGVVSKILRKSRVKDLKKIQEKRDESLESYYIMLYILDDLSLQIQEAKEPLNNYIKSRLEGNLEIKR